MISWNKLILISIRSDLEIINSFKNSKTAASASIILILFPRNVFKEINQQNFHNNKIFVNFWEE